MSRNNVLNVVASIQLQTSVSNCGTNTHTHTNPSEDKDPPRVLFSISSSALFVIRHSRSSVRESTTDKSLFLSQQLFVVVVPEIM